MFNMYLEAVAEKQTGRVVDIIKDRIARKFGLKLYVQHGAAQIQKENEGTVYGTMFMFEDGKHAFRLNWKSKDQSAKIHSVDFWLKPSINPQYTANTQHLNMIDIVYLIDEVINNGAKGKVEINSGSDDSGDDEPTKPVTEAAGEKPKSFAARWREAQASGDPDLIASLKKEYNDKRKAKYANVVAAPKEQLVAKEPDEWTALFDEPLDTKEIFSLMDDGIKKVINKTNKALLITGDAGIGKCIDGQIDLPCRFF